MHIATNGRDSDAQDALWITLSPYLGFTPTKSFQKIQRYLYDPRMVSGLVKTRGHAGQAVCLRLSLG